MNANDRAELVREIRFELKQLRRGGSGPTGKRNDSGVPNPTDRDNARDYVNEGMTDGGIYDRAARWDRYRAAQPASRRRRMPRAERDPGGYVGYTGDWRGHLYPDKGRRR